MVNLIIGFFLGVFGCAAGCLMRLAMEGRKQMTPMLTKEEQEKQERLQEEWNNLMNYTGPQK